jgi:predicted acetyltransferase
MANGEEQQGEPGEEMTVGSSLRGADLATIDDARIAGLLDELSQVQSRGSAGILTEEQLKQQELDLRRDAEPDVLGQVLGALIPAAIGAAIGGQGGALGGVRGAARSQATRASRVEDELTKRILAARAENEKKRAAATKGEADITRLRLTEALKDRRSRLQNQSRERAQSSATEQLALLLRANEKGTDFATKSILEKASNANDAILQSENIQRIITEGQASGEIRKNENILEALARNIGVKINPNTKSAELSREVIKQALESLEKLIKGNATEKERELLEEALGRKQTITVETLSDIQDVVQARQALEVMQQEDLFIERGLVFPGVDQARQRRQGFGTTKQLFADYQETNNPNEILDAYASSSLEPRLSSALSARNATTEGNRAGRVQRAKSLIQKLRERRKGGE